MGNTKENSKDREETINRFGYKIKISLCCETAQKKVKSNQKTRSKCTQQMTHTHDTERAHQIKRLKKDLIEKNRQRNYNSREKKEKLIKSQTIALSHSIF